MQQFRAFLGDIGALDGVLLPPAIDVLVNGLAVDPAAVANVGDTRTGEAQPGASATPLFFDLSLDPFGPEIPFRLTSRPDGFDLAFDLAAVPPATRLAALAGGAVGHALKPAEHNGVEGGDEWLTPAAGDVRITGATLALVVEGRKGAVATMRFGPSLDQPEGVVRLALDPPTVLLGDSGFGLALPDGLYIDMSAEAAPPPAETDGAPVALPGDVVAWKGLSIRNARFFLPDSTPLFGRTAVDAQIEIGLEPAGVALSAKAHAPAREGRPALDILIECMEPGATGIASFLPTLVEAAATLEVDGHSETVGGSSFVALSSRPLIARARFARDPDGSTRLAIGVESSGANGLLTVSGATGNKAAKGVIAAGAFATALIADERLGGGEGGTPAGALVVAGMALSTLLNDAGKLTVHAAELATEGKPKGLALADKQIFLLDYSVDVVIKPLDIGVLSVGLAPEQPLRARLRGVALALDHSKSGMGKLSLDFDHATMEVEDPGRWLVDGPGSLFDVLGSRSGRGSIWLEVDLRFKLNLGPIRVSGATIRATLNPQTNTIGAEIRGLDAALSIPGVIDGEGKIEVTQDGFAALIGVRIVPVGVGAEAFVRIKGGMVLLELGVDLPGPVPLFNSGLGLFGIGGTFGAAARIGQPAPGQDPVQYALQWDPQDDDAFIESPGNFSFGLEAVIGTLPDFGFAFSAKAGIFLTVPDIVVRGALDATIMSGPMSITHEPETDPLLALRGVIVVDPVDAVTFGVSGKLTVPVLLNATIPGGGRFPCGEGSDPSDWYFYLGADGYAPAPPAAGSDEGRGIGPARVVVLPGVFEQKADGYLMLRGDGVARYPRGEAFAQDYQGFILAFGFGVELVFGPKPVVWAEVTARADVLVATNPLVLAGFGRVTGSAHLGPVSVGVSADLKAFISEDRTSIYARVCGHVDLLLTTVRKCVELKFGSEPPLTVPWPDVLPLDRVEGGEVVGQNASLIDDRYRLLAALAQSPEDAATVWPDTLVSLIFAWPPSLSPGFAAGQFDRIGEYPEWVRAVQLGSNLLDYSWTLDRLVLLDVTGDPWGPGVPVAGPLSAAWQAGRTGDPGASAELAELVLLDVKGTFFIDRLADAGASLPHDPIGAAATICRPNARPQEGWTLAENAFPYDDAWRLPPEIVSGDPTRSHVAGGLVPGFRHSFDAWATVPLDEIGRSALPPFADFRPASRRVVSPRVESDRAFAAEIALPYVSSANGNDVALERQGFALVVTIYLEQSIVAGGWLYLLLQPSSEAAEKAAWRIHVQGRKYPEDASPRAWDRYVKELGDGRSVVVFAAPDGDAGMVTIEYPAGLRVGFLGLCGMTGAALAAAERRNQAQAAAAATQAEAAEQGPPVDVASQNGASRCLLQPDRTYRIDVDFSWTGTLYKQIMFGIRTPAATDGGAHYLPKGANPAEPPKARRQFFFKTTPVPSPPARTTPAPGGSVLYGVPAVSLNYGLASHLSELHRKQDEFSPKMLERHLGGYEPAQSEVARFRNDPLRAHFEVGHVAALADVYGYALKLALRRIDSGDESGDLSILTAVVSAALNPSFLRATDQRRFEVATGIVMADGVATPSAVPPCPTPRPGLTLEAISELEPRAWYELYVHAEPKDGAALHGRLDGVSFQTSRWFAPSDMVAALGFGASVAGQPAGDVEIAAMSGFPRGPALGDDGAFDDAMGRIGLEGWPVADVPRTSLLWIARQDASGWDCAGALVESPEPVHRPGRCHVERLDALLAPTQPPVDFNIAFRDRSGSRLLFLANRPFRPASWMTVGATVPGGKVPRGGGLILKRPVAGPLAKQAAKLSRTAPRTSAGRTIDLGKTFDPGRTFDPGLLGGLGGLGGGTRPIPLPIRRRPRLRLTLTDHDPSSGPAPLTGLLALPDAPYFAGEAR